jgi:glucose/arabinose dehydrogenase/plastocyanin
MKLPGFVRGLIAAVLLFGSGLGAVLAQDATPAADQPGQYIFYPSEPAQPGGDLPGEPQVQLVKVTDGLAEPINVDSPKDGSGRIFVAERGGKIRIVQDGQLLEEPFLDISGDVEFQFLEEGLLGFTFHPDYANNGLFYVNYTNLLRSGDVVTVQYGTSQDDPNKADTSSPIIISTREQPYPNHIGGDIHFGPDGYLYIGHGDGGLEGDPLDAGQDLTTHLGKMLRIDVSPAVAVAMGEDPGFAVVGGHAYVIPTDNPFTQGDILIDLFGATEDDFAELHPKAQPEIWSFGLRNPWSFSFDRETGDLWISDVGQNFWEEIDMEPADSEGGVNYGWKFLQGSHCFPDSANPDCPKVGTLPVAEYEHSLGCTVVGSSVYRGAEAPDLNGVYFAGDYCSGRVWGVAPDDAGAWQMEELLDTSLLLTGAGEDEAGEIYFTSCECGYGQNAPHQVGSLWKLVDANQVPEGAEVAPTGEEAEGGVDATPAVGEGIGSTPESGGTPASEGTPAGSTDAGSAAAIELEAGEMYFAPSEVTIPANTDAVIRINNVGVLPHNFSVVDQGIDVDFEAGAEVEVTVNLPPGTYEFICDIPGHSESGMVGTLIVE